MGEYWTVLKRAEIIRYFSLKKNHSLINILGNDEESEVKRFLLTVNNHSCCYYPLKNVEETKYEKRNLAFCKMQTIKYSGFSTCIYCLSCCFPFAIEVSSFDQSAVLCVVVIHILKSHSVKLVRLFCPAVNSNLVYMDLRVENCFMGKYLNASESSFQSTPLLRC